MTQPAPSIRDLLPGHPWEDLRPETRPLSDQAFVACALVAWLALGAIAALMYGAGEVMAGVMEHHHLQSETWADAHPESDPYPAEEARP